MQNQLNKIKLFFWLILIELIFIVFVFPFDAINKTVVQEKESYNRTYGQETTYQILDKAVGVTKIIYRESGIYDSLMSVFVEADKGADMLGSSKTLNDVMDYNKKRILAVEKVILIVTTRVSAIFEWLPFVSVFMLAMFANAYFNWKIKKTMFGAPSVALHFYAKNTAHFILMFFLLSLIAPFQMVPEFFPSVMFLYFVFLSITSATLSKSI